jgi:hypothetical protein
VVGFEGDVEVGPDKHAPAGDLDVVDALHGL